MNSQDRRPFSLIDAFFILILIVLTLAFLRILQPFLVDLFMAVIIANIFWGLFQWLKRHLKHNSAVAAGVTVISVILVVAIPVAGVILIVSKELIQGYQGLSSVVTDLVRNIRQMGLPDRLSQIPWLADALPSFSTSEIVQRVSGWASTGLNFVLDISQRSFKSLASTLAHSVLTFFLLYFLLLDGENLLARVQELIPMSDRDTDQLSRRTLDMTNATLISTLIIGGIEGLFGGLVFWAFGIEGPSLWGVVMMIVSIIPMVGANAVVWPGGIILILTGRIFAGIAVILLGMVGFTITQNVIKPKLLGDRSGIHPAIVLLSTLGGILWLGIIGFIIGPVLAALFISIWGQFGFRYRGLLGEKNVEENESETNDEEEPTEDPAEAP